MNVFDENGNKLDYSDLKNHFARQMHFNLCHQFMSIMKQHPTKTRFELEGDIKKEVDDLFIVMDWIEKNYKIDD